MKPNPKGLLHDHLDGSIALQEVIFDLYNLADRQFPFDSVEQWLEYMRDSSIDIKERFTTITSVLTTKDAIEMLVDAYGRIRAKEGYKYVEAKFSTRAFEWGNLTLRESADIHISAIKKAESDYNIRIVPVITIGRHMDKETGIEIAKIALEYDGEVVLDLVGNEAMFPSKKHREAFELTFGTNVRRDCHAGEWVALEPRSTYNQRLLENIRTAVFDLKCHSVGHAIPLVKDMELVDYIAENNIRVTGCPLSNLVSGFIDNVSELGIDTLLDRGVLYTLNPDDDLMFPPMEEVLQECDNVYQFTPDQAKKLEENVFRSAFAK